MAGKAKLDGKSIYEKPKKGTPLKKTVLNTEPKKKGKPKLGNVNETKK